MDIWFWIEEAAWDGGIMEASDFLQWAVCDLEEDT